MVFFLYHRKNSALLQQGETAFPYFFCLKVKTLEFYIYSIFCVCIYIYIMNNGSFLINLIL